MRRVYRSQMGIRMTTGGIFFFLSFTCQIGYEFIRAAATKRFIWTEFRKITINARGYSAE